MVEKSFNFDKDLAKFTPRQQTAVDWLDKGIKFLLYGGALGGGKSYFLRWYAVRLLMDLAARGFKKVTIMLACEDYPSLKDRQLQRIAVEFPSWLGRSYEKHKEYSSCFILAPEYGSGVICFRNLDDPSKYQSAEFAAILVDEFTKNDYDTFNALRMRLRWSGLTDQECKFVGGTNPGGIGHAFCKQLWMDKIFPDEFKKPIDYRPLFKYVPSLADDNPHLPESYWQMLETLPESMRKAFRYGSWDTFKGQAFTEWTPHRHVIEPIDMLAGVPLYMTFDWGYGAPFSLLWWWVDKDGRTYCFAEWYGWNGNPNQGLRLADSEIAEGIVRKEDQLGIVGLPAIRLAGPDCFSKKPDYRGGGQGPSTADVFKTYNIHLRAGDPDRKLKKRQFHERLRLQDDEMPMLVVYKGCEHFIRTIPSLVEGENDIEDINTAGEDHCYDSACHIVMDRMGMTQELLNIESIFA